MAWFSVIHQSLLHNFFYIVATFVTIYKGPKLHEKERKKKKKKKKNNKIKEKGERENIINKKKKIILANHKMKMHLG